MCTTQVNSFPSPSRTCTRFQVCEPDRTALYVRHSATVLVSRNYVEIPIPSKEQLQGHYHSSFSCGVRQDCRQTLLRWEMEKVNTAGIHRVWDSKKNLRLEYQVVFTDKVLRFL